MYVFGPFRLFPSRQLLMQGDRRVQLGARAFELLNLMVQRSGEVVGRDELVSAAWPNVFVHDSNLKVNMWSLRRSLGDTQKQPTYIATVAGRGYRFVSVVQTSIAGIVEESTPVETPRMRGLPPQPHIVGRESEITDILASLRDRRQITVVGTGGVGKTTVAVAAAQAFAEECADGVCFVDFSTSEDPALVPAALAAALGLRGDPADALAAVIGFLERRQVLVVLDNCEHVLRGVAAFTRAFTARDGRSKLLATSREALDTPAEHVVWLGPLACPDSDEGLTMGELMRFPAVDLFARRASEWAGYELVDADCPAVVQICRALDGLPLAIELAASKAERHAMPDLLAMLDRHLSVPGTHSPRAPRQETLLATIDWSYRLLSPNEATIFGLISVFAEAFELEDIAAVAATANLRPAHVTTGLGGLVAKSLLTAQVSGAGLRYQLLDSTRRYATMRRLEAGLDRSARRAHAERILALFEQSEAEWGWRDGDDWTQRYLGRIADVRAALAWAFDDGGDANLGVRLTVATIPLWFERSLISETQSRVELALVHAEKIEGSDLLKTKLAISRAWCMNYARVFVPEIEEIWLTALTFARRAGNLAFELQALAGLAIYMGRVGRIRHTIERLEEFRALCARHQDWSLAPEGERLLAWAKANTGDLTASLAILERLAAAHPQIRKGSRMAGFQVDRYIGIRCYIPVLAWASGRPDYGAAVARAAIEAAESTGHLLSQSNVLALAGCPVALLNGDIDFLERCTTRLRSILEIETLANWIPMRRFFAAALDDLRGHPGAAAGMRSAIDELIETRFFRGIAGFITVLAETLVREGRLDEASDAIAEAMRYEAQQGVRLRRPELMRVEAKILQRAGSPARAESLFGNAIEEAHAIDALSYELRIANDLATHYLETGRSDEAAGLLLPLYRQFGEGFATRDLIAADGLIRRARGSLTIS